MKKRVVVIGGGIAGLTASLTAAELGERVLLLESSPSIGGMLERLDTWFTDDACGMCQILPQLSSDDKLDRCLRTDFYHPLIDIRTLSVIKSLEHTNDGMVLTVKRLPRFVDEIKCTACRLCEEVCPVEGPDAFDKGLTKHKAIHTLYAGSLTKTYYIDKTICTECGKCVDICPTKAIDLKQEAEEEKFIAKSIILSAGFTEIDPSTLSSFGYGKFPNVVSSLDFERLISRTGLHPGQIRRPSDGKIPKKIAIIQCVGSRDKDREYCSSACCMYGIKEARKIKEMSNKTEVSIFYMDLRTFGKGHYAYYLDADKMGIKFRNFRIPSVSQDKDSKLTIKLEENGKIKTEKYDMVILSTGQEISEGTRGLLDILGVEKDDYGFVRNKDFESFKTSKENIYAAGSIVEPKDIEGSIIDAEAAGTLPASETPAVNEEVKKALDLDYAIAKFGIFVCLCGGVINKSIDTDKIKDALANKPEASVVSEIDFVCQGNSIDEIMKNAIENHLTRLIFATCSPAKYEILIRQKVSSYGFEQAMVEILPLREQIAWAYDSAGEDAAIQAIEALVEKLRFAVPQQQVKGKGISRAIVIGGGLAGMTAALNLSKKTVKVELIERGSELGGNAQKLSTTLEGEDVRKFLSETVKRVENDENITTHLMSEISSIDGSAGNFMVAVKKGDDTMRINAGAIIVATGAEEYKPTEYLYGKDKRIITQLELEEKITNNQLPITNKQSIVMIQCVGSRNDEHPWCSKVCCSDAIKNALELRKKNKDMQIAVLYRDMMTYGKKELKFKEAREKGINFVRFDKNEEPLVEITEAKLKVTIKDKILQNTLQFEPDFLVLSTGIVPTNNSKLSKILGITLDKDGFFKGVNSKFRPLESERLGIYFAGLCRSPSGIRDAVSEATAVAGKASLFLRETELLQRRTVSEVIERWCGGCEFCVDACPFDARYLDTEKKIVKVIEINCVGCGNCVSVCPSGAAKLRGSKDRQMISIIDVSV